MNYIKLIRDTKCVSTTMAKLVDIYSKELITPDETKKILVLLSNLYNYVAMGCEIYHIEDNVNSVINLFTKEVNTLSKIRRQKEVK